MNRRDFLGAMLAAATVAPTYVRAGSLMKLAAPSGMEETEGGIFVPPAPGTGHWNCRSEGIQHTLWIAGAGNESFPIGSIVTISSMGQFEIVGRYADDTRGLRARRIQ